MELLEKGTRVQITRVWDEPRTGTILRHYDAKPRIWPEHYEVALDHLNGFPGVYAPSEVTPIELAR